MPASAGIDCFIRPSPSRDARGRVAWLRACAALAWSASLPASVPAQQPTAAFGRYRLDVWRAQDGVRLAFTSNMVETRDGYLWLSSESGVTRFDGVRFSVRPRSIRRSRIADRSQLYKDLAAGPFFGFNRPGAKASPGMIDWFWLQGMMGGHKNTLDCIKAFSETDFTEDLKKFDVPTLIVHGDDDQVVPIDAAGRASANLVRGATLRVYPGAPHGLTDTHKERLNADLLAFLRASASS